MSCTINLLTWFIPSLFSTPLHCRRIVLAYSSFQNRALTVTFPARWSQSGCRKPRATPRSAWINNNTRFMVHRGRRRCCGRATSVMRRPQCYAHDMWGMYYSSVIRGFWASSVAMQTTYGYLAHDWDGENERLRNFFQAFSFPSLRQRGGVDPLVPTLTLQCLPLSSTNHYCFSLLSNPIVHEDAPWNFQSEKMNGHVVSWKGIKRSISELWLRAWKVPVCVIRKGFFCVLP